MTLHRNHRILLGLAAALAVAVLTFALVSALGPVGAQTDPAGGEQSSDAGRPHPDAPGRPRVEHVHLRHRHLRHVWHHRARRYLRHCILQGDTTLDECRAELRGKIDAFRSCMSDQGFERGWLREHWPLDADERSALRSALEACRQSVRSTTNGA